MMIHNSFDINEPAVLNVVAKAFESDLMESLQQQGYNIILLRGANVLNQVSFLDAFTDQILADQKAENWSQFQDFLFQVITQKPDEKVAFVWNDVQEMLKGGLLDLITCCDIFATISREVYLRGKVVLTFLVGEGANFPKPKRL